MTSPNLPVPMIERRRRGGGPSMTSTIAAPSCSVMTKPESYQVLRAECTRVGEHACEDHRHQQKAQRCRAGIVLDHQELLLNDVADHGGLRAAQVVRIDEVTHGGDEHQQA